MTERPRLTTRHVNEAAPNPVQRSPDFWHARYAQQASWTAALRRRAYAQASLVPTHRVLEVGAGTGVITTDLRRETGARVFGVDCDLEVTRFAHRQDPLTRLALADARSLPFADGSFEATVSHFLLLWVENPEAAVREMARVTRPGGWVLCLAEPDYGGRIDHPALLASAGMLQAEALRRQGADPLLGRRLRELLTLGGLGEIQVGVLGGEWQGVPSQPDIDSEWATLASDLEGLMSEHELAQLRRAHMRAVANGTRLLFVPTFFGFGRNPA